MRKPFEFLPLGKGLSLIVVIFVCIVACLLLLNNARSEILSGVRAYVNGEALYSKGQKDAVYHLVRYAHSRSETDYAEYLEAIAVPLGDGEARLELDNRQSDLARVRRGFIAGRNDPDDLDNLVKLFKRFRHVSFMSTAIDVWAQGDALILKLRDLGSRLHASIGSGQADPEETSRILQDVDTLNEQLSVLEDKFSHTLGEGNRWLERRLLQVSYAATALLLMTGVFLSWMILRQVGQAEHALRTQAERWRVTLASIGDGVLVADADGTIISLNPVAETLTGWKETDAVGRKVDEVFRLRAERLQQPVENPAHRALRGGLIAGLGNDDGVLLAKDGTEKSVDDSAAPIKDRAGRIVGVVVVFRDVGERRRAAEVVRRSEERYRSLVAVTASVLWTTDAAGAFVSPQPPWEVYTGQRWDEGPTNGWLNAIHPDDRERMQALWGRSLAERTILQAEGRVLHAASRRYRYVVAHAVPLLNTDGSVREWIGTLTDVDDRKRVEETLQEANLQKDNFLAMLAHELRNPLSSIRSAAYILGRNAPKEPSRERTREMIDRQVSHMSRLLDDLLDVSRVARGKILLRQDVIDLARVVRLAAEDYRTTFEAAGLTLALTVPDSPIWVKGDATRLSQVVGNLLHNASKFAGAGGSVTMNLTVDADTLAVLTVRDTGIGMEPEILNRVFETFTQAEQTLDRGHGGLGLGLALVKGLVQLHGGTVQAASAGLGKGSEFTICLPLESPPLQSSTNPAQKDVQQRCRRVLVIEDNLDVAESMKYLLEADGHQVVLTHTGPAGIEAAREFRPEVVLCDIGLPGGMDGFAVAKAMRSDGAFNSACLIALTGYGREEDQRRAREAGFDVHLIKPVDPAVLDRILAAFSERANS